MNKSFASEPRVPLPGTLREVEGQTRHGGNWIPTGRWS